MLDKMNTKHILIVMAVVLIAGVAAVVWLLSSNGTPAPVETAQEPPLVVAEETPVSQITLADIVPPSGGVNPLVFANPFGLPETPHGGNILHAWNMRFVEIIEQLPYIAEAGFGVIQTSPIGAALIRQEGRGAFGRWYDLYQPTHFTIGNYLGTEEEFRALTLAAAEYGIFVIVDAIPNHTTAYWNEIDPNLTDFYPSLFHSRRGEDMLSNVWMTPMNFNDRRSFVRGNLLGLWDFYTSRPEFQEIYSAFLGNIIDAGASGFRFDAAHHIELPNDPPDIASDFWPVVSAFVDNRIHELGRIPFQYGEILGQGYRANHYLHALFEHANYRVTSYAHSRHILSTVTLGFLVDGRDGWNSYNYLIHGNPQNHGDSVFGPAFIAADLGGFEGFGDGVVPWVESHDQYGNDGMSRHLTNEQILVGWAILAARQGTSPLFFVRPGDGFINSGNMFSPQPDGSFINNWGHQDFFRDPAVAAINWFANDYINLPERTSTHGNVAIIERGDIGAVLANVGTAPVQVVFPVQLADGFYTCQITNRVYHVQDGWLTGPDIWGQSVLVLRHPRETSDFAQSFIGFYPTSDSGYFYSPDGVTLTFIEKNTNRLHMISIVHNGEASEREFIAHGETVTFGAGAEIGDVFIVSLIDLLSSSSVPAIELTFTKIEQPEEPRIRVEYVRNENPWPQAGIWAWNDRGDVFTGGWPGPQMEWAPRLDGEGYAWVFYLPEGTIVPVSLIFNNMGQGEQTTPYLVITESTRVFQMGDGVEIGNAIPLQP